MKREESSIRVKRVENDASETAQNLQVLESVLQHQTFEKNQALLVKSVEKKDAAKSSAALESMAEALLAYRTSGKLLGPDGGGDIPSVDEIRRSTKRFRGDAFEAKVKERDERLKAAAAATGN